jgi:hypothetical protein
MGISSRGVGNSVDGTDVGAEGAVVEGRLATQALSKASAKKATKRNSKVGFFIAKLPIR